MPGRLMVVNPIRKRKRKSHSMSAKQRKYFGKRRSRSRTTRRNPVTAMASSPVRRSSRRRRYAAKAKSYIRRARGSEFGNFISGTMIPGAIGAAGALGVDMAWARLPIPDMLKTGAMAPIARIGLAVGVGYAVGMVAGKSYGRQATNGAVLVTLYDLAKNYIAPSVPATAPAVSAYVRGLGWTGPAQTSMGRFVGDEAYNY